MSKSLAVKKFDHQKIDAKWQKFWRDKKIFEVSDRAQAPLYVLDMFAYPSGDGLHVGHPKGYTASDIVAKYYMLHGRSVLHPFGWDAFGLPAENYAIKVGEHPHKTTQANIKRFTQQLTALGLGYDWSREINTSSPGYYKWTQWLFIQLYQAGLAYQKNASVNWCPKDKTVLANEQVVGGACERCGTAVVQQQRKQWFFKITEFADELLAGLDELDWPESTKQLQRNWIGRSDGAEISFKVVGHKSKIMVFTTRPDTLYGATYLVLAPEYPGLSDLVAADARAAVEEYVEQARGKTELERMADAKSKTGVFTGAYVVNPASGENIPVWVADYVLAGYGSGAIMAVPAHDQRDFEFAKQYKLPIVEVVAAPGGALPYTGHGQLVNSGEFGGSDSGVVGPKIVKSVGGKPKTQYKLRDWLVSRQRYWGAPIPVMYDKDDKPHVVTEQDLPVVLPDDVEFAPTGESPLAGSKKFAKIPARYKGMVRREFDTLDTFVCSAWYFLRYVDPHNTQQMVAARKLDQWLPVDIYVGGAEHATTHLLYARFITRALHRLGWLSFREPFIKLRHQGMVLGEGGVKMSKSKGNVINPDEVVAGYGADAFRMYEMFMGPFNHAAPWNTAGIEGVRRFLNRVWSLEPQAKAPETDRAIHRLIKKIGEDIETFGFNTSVSSFMEFVNLAGEHGITKPTLKILVILLAPFVPHLAEEMHARLGAKRSVFASRWPTFDESKLMADLVQVAVQVDGKLRATVEVEMTASADDVEQAARGVARVAQHLTGGNHRVHYVPGRIINFVSQ